MITKETMSVRLRRETTSDHRAAEMGDVMHRLLRGELPLSGYLDLVVQMQAVYDALDTESARWTCDPRFGEFFDPGLARSQSLATDRHALEKRLSLRGHEILTSTLEFVERIVDVGSSSPLLLLAHHYTRFMGDLSGGIMIGRAVDKTYGFDGGPGVTWFQFPNIDDVTEYKDAYRSRLDRLDLDESEAIALIDEVHRSYALNGGILLELSARHS